MTLFRADLVPHAASPESPVEHASVTVSRVGAVVRIRYEMTGDIARVALPAPTPPARRDELWKTTCFELFVRAGDEDGYLEWNFSPSGEWAAYVFDGYRAGMRDADVVAPLIVTEGIGDRFRMDVTVALDDTPLHVGISAVIRDTHGHTSYWALTHPPGKPDFHHADCFTAELAPSPTP